MWVDVSKEDEKGQDKWMWRNEVSDSQYSGEKAKNKNRKMTFI